MSVPERVTHIEEPCKERAQEGLRYKRVEHNQNFVVLSIIERIDDNPPAIKIFGMYSSVEEANRVSKKINNDNDYLNIYVASSNEWIPIPPTTEFIENIVYQEEKLQQIQAGYTKQKEHNAQELTKSIKRDMKDSLFKKKPVDDEVKAVIDDVVKDTTEN